MQCLQARSLLSAGMTRGPAIAVDPDLVAHLRRCPACRDFGLQRLLAQDPQLLAVPSASAGFADRAIATAVRRGAARRRYSQWGAAAAAALVVGGTAVFLMQAAPGGDARTLRTASRVAMVPHEVRPVRVMIDSAADRDDATVSIELAENLELDGYPNQRQLSWKTDLQRGRNLLNLPLVLQDASNSYVKVTYSFGSIQKQIGIAIQAAAAHGRK